jgi:hypothetical protein
MNEKLWMVQQCVEGEWINIYPEAFESWAEAKNIFDGALLSQKMMNIDNGLRLIECKNEN